MLIAAGQRLQQEGIALEDLGIRHPSLDDVFLSLTGHAGAATQGDPLERADADGVRPPVASASTVSAARTSGRVLRNQRRGRPRRHPLPGRTALTDTRGVAKRNLLPSSVFAQPAAVGDLRAAAGTAARALPLRARRRHPRPGRQLLDFIVPAVFIEAVMIGGIATAIGLADDLRSGIIDRFRSLPMARSAVLAGRTLADLSRSVFSLALMVGLGLLVGFTFHGSIGAIIAGLVLVIFFGYCFSWVATIGLVTRDPETAQVAGILPFFILVFATQRSSRRSPPCRAGCSPSHATNR